ncbi:oxysterol-binding protein [Ophiocordyceps camponoti-floridani]|uniref:Oxysterol-binding protein n=1 Tax=Ophiocordyceps camponoti-floridani TaxID=2030778 RepID=A0A8H4Q9M5_9HYPO|nr:oxysterol-binding protein [Ophiocordyceps camponoti-floridani]
MTEIERLEVHSKSYVVRFVKVDPGHTLSWSVQPHKKSINVGIVKHPAGAASPPSPTTDEMKKEPTALDMLAAKGFIPILWHGKCEADKASPGTYDVLPGQGGMYALVFDNTFSKQTSKTVSFVVLKYPTGSPPLPSGTSNLSPPREPSGHSSSARIASPHNEFASSASADSLPSQGARAGKPRSMSARSDLQTCYVGYLSKRRRKKGQGYARRFFSLDFSTCTLSYYYNRNSSALRGAIPLSLAAISADERRKEISIDSGAEIWHIRAYSDREFQDWARALERTSRIARSNSDASQPPTERASGHRDSARSSKQAAGDEDMEWQQVEALVSRVVGTRDALRRLTSEVASLPRLSTSGQQQLLATDEAKDGDSPTGADKRPFWKRVSSMPIASPLALQQVASSPEPTPTPWTRQGEDGPWKRGTRAHGDHRSIHHHCEALLADLDSVVSEFSALIVTKKRQRTGAMPSSMGVASRISIDSVSTRDEFFDAEDAKPAVVKIGSGGGGGGSGDESPGPEVDDADTRDGSSVSSTEDAEPTGDGHQYGHLFPARPKSLAPLPMDKAVARRTTITAATVQPPSLIAFVRKNVGKDLSTISMPVSANEPLSLLQKLAEQMEYGQLLDRAARNRSVTERLLLVSAFAVSQFSGGRAKERSMRKPFNPLLGETFELVRTDGEVPGGFRLLVEKVEHRPVRLAMQADSANWSFSQSPAPGQKFWGKSAEITTEGRVRVALRLADGADELYSWNVATMFLRNVVMGEKYVEPVGTMTVTNDSSGHKAVVEFKSKGMFGGRSEEVQVTALGPDGADTGRGLTGTWTGGLRTVGPGKAASEEVWRTGRLVEQAATTYGLTEFAASLNELTDVERGRLPPTDSRLRPDQRLAEQGRLDEAEESKQRLEEAQRARRRDAESRGEAYRPRWFYRAEGGPEGEEVWKLKTGKEGYWEERERGQWTGVGAIFE